MWEEEFKAQDKNGDGFLQSTEVSSQAPSDLQWDKYDLDKDGTLSLAEFLQWAQIHQMEGDEEEGSEEGHEGEEDPEDPEADEASLLEVAEDEEAQRKEA